MNVSSLLASETIDESIKTTSREIVNERGKISGNLENDGATKRLKGNAYEREKGNGGKSVGVVGVVEMSN